MEQSTLKGFLEDLQQQLRLYRQMIDLNRSQQALIEESEDPDSDALMRLVHDKQQLMLSLAESETRVKPFKDQWKDIRDSLNEKVRAFATDLLNELAETVEQLIKMEDEAHKLLQGRMAGASDEMDELRRKSQVNKAYSAYGNKSKPRYVDRSSQDS